MLATIKMGPIEGDQRHDSRCLKFTEIDWAEPIQASKMLKTLCRAKWF